MIIEITIRDREQYARYVEAVPPIIKKYGGEYFVRGDAIQPMFGDWHPERIVLIQFPDMQSLRRCFESKEYLSIAPFRERSTNSKAIVVEGCS